MLMLGPGGASAPDEDYVLMDLGTSRSTCPMSHAHWIPWQWPSETLDLQTADYRPIAHYGKKTVLYDVPEGVGIEKIGINWEVADEQHPTLGVAEAVNHGHSVLFSLAGAFMAPTTLTLPAGTPHVPLHRHENLYWMRSRPATASPSGSSPSRRPGSTPIDEVLEGIYRQESVAGATATDHVEVISLQDEATRSLPASGVSSRPGSGSEAPGEQKPAPGEEAVADDLAILAREPPAQFSAMEISGRSATRTPFGGRPGWSAASEAYRQCRASGGTRDACAAAALVACQAAETSMQAPNPVYPYE